MKYFLEGIVASSKERCEWRITEPLLYILDRKHLQEILHIPAPLRCDSHSVLIAQCIDNNGYTVLHNTLLTQI